MRDSVSLKVPECAETPKLGSGVPWIALLALGGFADFPVERSVSTFAKLVGRSSDRILEWCFSGRTCSFISVSQVNVLIA